MLKREEVRGHSIDSFYRTILLWILKDLDFKTRIKRQEIIFSKRLSSLSPCPVSLSSVLFHCPLSCFPVSLSCFTVLFHGPLSCFTVPCPVSLSPVMVHCPVSLSPVLFHCPLSCFPVLFHCPVLLSCFPVSLSCFTVPCPVLLSYIDHFLHVVVLEKQHQRRLM